MRWILSRAIPLMALAAAICVVAGTACGGNDGENKGATETASSPSASETVPGEVETAARRLLAGELEADEGELKLDGSESVQWSDASLGCPQEGMMYAQVITPGYRLVFYLAGASHAVHTNSGRLPHSGLRRRAVGLRGNLAGGGSFDCSRGDP